MIHVKAPSRKQSLENLREPTWRRDRAQELVDSGSRHLRFEDKAVRDIVSYIRDKVDGVSDRHLIDKWGPLHVADRIYYGQERYLVEAMVVARAPTSDIAAQFGLPDDVISHYESNYFDVRDRLDNKGFVMSKVLRAWGGAADRDDRESLWRGIAYTGGLEQLMAMWEAGVVEERVLSWFRSLRRSQGAVKAAIAVRTLAPSAFNAELLVNSDQVQQKFDFEKETKEAGSGRDAANQEMESAGREMFDQISNVLVRVSEDRSTMLLPSPQSDSPTYDEPRSPTADLSAKMTVTEVAQVDPNDDPK